MKSRSKTIPLLVALLLGACTESPEELQARQEAFATSARQLAEKGNPEAVIDYINGAPTRVREAESVAHVLAAAREELSKREARRLREERLNRIQIATEALSGVSTRDISGQSVSVVLALFDEARSSLRAVEADEDADEGTEQAARKLRSTLSQKQSQLFPVMRRAYAKQLDDSLWENDTDVEAYGSGSRNIRFIAGVFAANRNIAEAQRAASPMLRRLRFRRSRYEWYRGSEYTYYDLDPPADSQIDD